MRWVPAASRLLAARLRTQRGELLLFGAGIVAAAVCSAILFTLAGGTWMFYQRFTNPSGLLAELSHDPFFHMVLAFYVGLASCACALVLPSAITLAIAGAQLGARGREQRLSALRLVGLSSRDVTRMALLDTLLQAVVGTGVGFVVYRATLPLWSGMTFQAVAVRPGEMGLPWNLVGVVAVTLVTVNCLAAAWGLRRVRITPLGVARRTRGPRASLWRLAAFPAILLACYVFVNTIRVEQNTSVLLVVAAVVVLFLIAVDLIGPWLLQLLTRPVARHAPGAALRLASWRIVNDPRATWRRASNTAVLAFIASSLACAPFSYDLAENPTPTEQTFMDRAQPDLVTGGIIALGAGLLLTAAHLLITQASATVDRAHQSRALQRMGAPSTFALRTMWLETLLPLMGSTAMGSLMGVALAWPMRQQLIASGMAVTGTPWRLLVVLLLGLAIAAGAVAASTPLHHRLLQNDRRSND
ncbi:hypothetical protein [Luteococcus sp. H138]|uniref:hypothetical protein n=1 Tax=Luteococcus sp. H138 TaxID=3139404 RepID=UPI00406C4583